MEELNINNQLEQGKIINPNEFSGVCDNSEPAIEELEQQQPTRNTQENIVGVPNKIFFKNKDFEVEFMSSEKTFTDLYGYFLHVWKKQNSLLKKERGDKKSKSKPIYLE